MWLRGKARRPFHAFCLQQVAPFVSRDDLEPGSHRETHQRNKRVLEPDAVDVVAASATNHVAGRLIRVQEAVENGRLDAHTRHYFLGCRSALALGRRLDKAAKKPPAKSARPNLPDNSSGLAWQRVRDCR